MLAGEEATAESQGNEEQTKEDKIFNAASSNFQVTI